MGGVPGAEAASQFEVLALGCFKGLPQGLDLIAVLPLELGELGGEGAHDAAGRVVGRLRGRLWRMVSLLGPQLLDASADLGGPVEEVERDVGGLGEAAARAAGRRGGRRANATVADDGEPPCRAASW
ncbi:hypothetical protein [Streptomyces sp. NPDC054794]